MRTRDVIINVLVTLAALILLAIGLYTIPEMKCQQIASAMQRPYIFQPFNGCWIQTAGGNWQRVDQSPTSYQP